MIRVENLSKYFGAKCALKNLNFTISRGEYVALLGVNGAGKTTLTRILATLSKPTSGIVRIDELTLKESVLIRKKIGVMSHYSFLYNDLTAKENLNFYARMYGLSSPSERIYDLLNKVGLASRSYDRVGTFSRGMQQRLSLARAILHSPTVLFLDEPFAGLDVNASQIVKDLLNEFIVQECTVLLTTHDITFALENSKRIMILRNGELVENQLASQMSVHHIREKMVIL